MFFEDANINTVFSAVEYYIFFNYAEDHATYPLKASMTNKLVQFPTTSTVVGFLSVKSGNVIVLWLVEVNKNRLTQNGAWSTPATFYTNANNIISLYYAQEGDYIIALFIDLDGGTGNYQLKAYTRKFTFNTSVNPTSFTPSDGNSDINTKLIIDTFTTTQQISGYYSSQNTSGWFNVVLNNKIYTYRWDFGVSNQNQMVRNYQAPGGTPISHFTLLTNQHFSITQSDNYFLYVQFSNFDSGIIRIKDSTCLGMERDLQVGKCFNDCPNYEEQNWTNMMCRDCTTYYSGAKNFFHNGLCKNTCSPFAAGANNVCTGPVTCTSPNYSDPISNTCVATCPTYLIPNAGTRNCDNCKDSSTYSVNGACAVGASCPALYFLDDATRNGCKTCLANGQYYDSGTSSCVASCSQYLIPNTTNGNCDNCKTLSSDYSYNGACVAGTACPTNTILGDASKNGCYDCKSISKYYESGVCHDTCPGGKTPDADNICLGCSATQYTESGKCVNQCSSGYVSNSLRQCVKCSTGLFIYENQCITTCPGYLGSDQTNTCINCKSIQQYSFNNKCQDSILTKGVLVDESYNAYVSCSNAVPKQYVYKDGCVKNCPFETATRENGNECFNWRKLGLALYKGSVVDICPQYFIPNQLRVCVTCKEIGKFYLSEKCVDKCPDHFFYDDSNFCFECSFSSKIYSGNKCVGKCAFYMYTDPTTDECVYCAKTGLYFLFGETQCREGGCPDGTYQYPIHNLCSKDCRDINAHIFGRYCSLLCPEGTSLDKLTNKCLYGFSSKNLGIFI
ncbi:MAG: hypothetical protein GY861_24655 [bacterium]|nr:hypothetical protein [bacterium]